MFFIFPDNSRGSSFEGLYDIWYCFIEWSSQIEVYMIFFHTYSYDRDIEIFADSFEHLFDGTLKFI